MVTIQLNYELPKLDGEIVNWRVVLDQFQVPIHENKTFTEIDQFTYLKSFLTNSALSVLTGLTLT